MNDITHIGLVDSHSKCIGGYHHTTAVINKIILIVPAFLIRKSCMISGGRDAVTDQLSADLLHQLSGETVDDSTVVRMLQYVIVYFLIFIFRCFHCKIKVFPIKSCGCAKGILKPQKSCNILSDLLRGCSCKCTDHRSFWKLCHKLCDLQIAWPKILSPLWYTVWLIHCDHGNIRAQRKIQKRLCGKPLRCYIDDRISSCLCIAQGCEILPLRQRAVEVCCWDADLVQASHLILHKGDQRWYYQCDPLHHQCRYLIADGFSCAGWHHCQNIFSCKKRIDHRFLPFSESIIPKVGL